MSHARINTSTTAVYALALKFKRLKELRQKLDQQLLGKPRPKKLRGNLRQKLPSDYNGNYANSYE